MARRKSKLKKFTDFLKKSKVSATSIAIIVVAVLTINTFIPISNAIPTWGNIKDELLQMVNDNEVPVIGDFWFQGDNNKDEDVTGNNLGDTKNEVHVIDVGQGSCTLLISDSEYVLIDTGESSEYDKVSSYLNSKGVEQLSYVIVTHMHSDHMGGMSKLLNEFEVDTVITTKLTKDMIPTTRVYENMLIAMDENNVELEYAKVGAKYSFGKADMEILAPRVDFKDYNNTSVITKINMGEVSFLCTGDAEHEAEEKLLKENFDLSANVFILGHHGSNTSNSEELLEQVGAEYYVAQAGYGNSYGHPNREIIELVEDMGGTLYRSDVDGDIIFKTDGEKIEVLTIK